MVNYKLYIVIASVALLMGISEIRSIAQDRGWQDDFDRALKIYDEGRYAEALPLLQGLVRRNPGDPKAHYKLGVALNKTGKNRLAEQEFREVLKLKEDFPNAHYNLGVCLLEDERWDDAVPILQRATELDSTDPGAAFQLGIAFFNLNRFPLAEVQFRAAIRLREDYPNAHFNLGQTLIKGGRCEDAVLMLERATELDKADEDVWIRLAYAYECTRKWKEAEEVYTRGASHVPYQKRPDLLLRRSAVYLAGGGSVQAADEAASLLKGYGWASQIGGYAAVIETLAVAKSHGVEASSKFLQEALSKCSRDLWPYGILLGLVNTAKTAAESSDTSWTNAEMEAAVGYYALVEGKVDRATALLKRARPCVPPGSPLRSIADGALFVVGVSPQNLPACPTSGQGSASFRP